jgi:hypothetical protein
MSVHPFGRVLMIIADTKNYVYFVTGNDQRDRTSIKILQVIAVAARPSSSVGGGGGAAALKFHRTTLMTLSQQTLLQNSSSLRF